MNHKSVEMEGITIIHDQTNDKRYAQIDLDIYGQKWEDFYDGLMVEIAKDDVMIPLDEVIQDLKAQGIFDAEI